MKTQVNQNQVLPGKGFSEGRFKPHIIHLNQRLQINNLKLHLKVLTIKNRSCEGQGFSPETERS